MSKPAHLFLVRHAHIDCSRNGSPLLCGSHDAALSPAGLREVKLLRERLIQEEGFDAACSSPLRRAVATAQAAPLPLLRRLRLLRSIAEIHCGAVEGMPVDEIRQRLPDEWRRNEVQNDEEFCWPGGETYRHFRRRVLRAIAAIARVHSGRRVLIMTHAGVVNQILGTLAGQSAGRWENFRPGNTGVTEVLWEGDSGEVIRLDDRAHLR